LGWHFKLKDKLPEAMAELHKAAELDPGQADVHYTLGVTLWQQGDFAAAAEELRAAIMPTGTMPRPINTRNSTEAAGRIAGGRDCFCGKRFECSRTPPALIQTLATVLRQLGDAEGAAAESRPEWKSQNRKPATRPRSLPQTQDAASSTPETSRAPFRNFRAAINSSPKYAAATLNWGWPLRQQGKSEEAARRVSKGPQNSILD